MAQISHAPGSPFGVGGEPAETGFFTTYLAHPPANMQTPVANMQEHLHCFHQANMLIFCEHKMVDMHSPKSRPRANAMLSEATSENAHAQRGATIALLLTTGIGLTALTQEVVEQVAPQADTAIVQQRERIVVIGSRIAVETGEDPPVLSITRAQPTRTYNESLANWYGGL